MPAGNEGKPTVVDLDAKIAECSRAIAFNPNDARAYRDRGLFRARKRDFYRAINDFDRAILLDPDDAHSYGLRGLVWETKNDSARAVADFEKAIELDSVNSGVYRSHREKILENSAYGSPIGIPISSHDQENPDATPQVGLVGFFKRLAQYYAEFLSTDFKRQRLPRRRLQNSDALGRLVGIPLRKYPGFQQKMWEELAKPIGGGLSINVSRGSWRSTLPKAVIEATATHIGYVAQEDLDEVVSAVLNQVTSIVKQKGSDPVIAFERFIEELRASLARRVISPLLDRMEGCPSSGNLRLIRRFAKGGSGSSGVRV
jgi:tetratricopeptide (TPR) repeat protein